MCFLWRQLTIFGQKIELLCPYKYNRVKSSIPSTKSTCVSKFGHHVFAGQGLHAMLRAVFKDSAGCFKIFPNFLRSDNCRTTNWLKLCCEIKVGPFVRLLLLLSRQSWGWWAHIIIDVYNIFKCTDFWMPIIELCFTNLSPTFMSHFRPIC